MDNEGIALSRRRITLSTSGVVPMMDRAGAELGVNLAVSLHAVRDELRDELVPLNRKYPIAELIAACRRYPGASNARRITFEYVMLKGVNDSQADARELVRLIAGIPAKVNLIPFNPWPGEPVRDQQQQRDRPVRGHRDGCGVRLAGALAARPRHPGGMRPAAHRKPPRPDRTLEHFQPDRKPAPSSGSMGFAALYPSYELLPARCRRMGRA